MSNSGHDPYGSYSRSNRTAIDSPRKIEGEALLKAARQLDEVKNNWGAKNNAALEDALTFNRKLWTIFVTEMEKDINGLNPSIRANITNLGVFVFEKTVDIIAAPDPAKLGVLIAINQNIAAGLLAHSDGSEPEEDRNQGSSGGGLTFDI